MVSLDTRKSREKLQSSSSMVASVPKHLWSSIHNTQPQERLAVRTSRVHDCDDVISRWSPFGTC